MNKNAGIVGGVVLVMVALIYGLGQRADAIEARMAAERAAVRSDSLTLIVTDFEQMQSGQEAHIRRLEESLARADSAREQERAANARQRAELRRRITAGTQAMASSMEELIVRVDTETRGMLERWVEEDTQIHVDYETTIVSLEEDKQTLEEDKNALRVRLGEVTQLAQINKDGWDAERSLRLSETERADSWERVANPPFMQKIVESLPAVGLGAGVTVGVLFLAGVIN